jgi:hypothetical protein
MKKIKPVIIAFMLVMIMLMVVTAVYASGGASFSLQTVSANPAEKPAPYFVFEQTAGGLIEGQVQVKNTSLETGTVRLYAVDAATGNTSGIVYGLGDDPKSQVGTWVKLAVEELTLASGESEMVPFTVAVPNDVRGGQHVGAIVAEAVTTQGQQSVQVTNDQAAFHVEVKGRSAIAVQVNVPGAVVSQIDVNGIEIGGQNGVQTLMLNLHNSGTEIEKPIGRIIITDEAGEQVQGVRFRMDSFLPNTHILYPVPVEYQALNAGEYGVMLTMQYGADRQVYEHTMVFSVSEKENLQIFTPRPALESPVVIVDGAAMNQPFLSSPTGIIFLSMFVLFLVIGGYFAFAAYQNDQKKKLQRQQAQPKKITAKPVRQFSAKP